MLRYCALLLLVATAVPPSPSAGTVTFDRAGFPDGTVLTTQYPGVTFAIELGAAIGQDGRTIDHTRLLLLAAADGELSGSPFLWEHGAADCGGAAPSRPGWGAAAGKQTGRRKEGNKWLILA